jgi:acyl-CoA reductase-like NAD-dependent aldehyde dehydrogenase
LEERWRSAEAVAAIVVHSLGHAIAALTAAAQAGRAVVLVSAPQAGGYVGPGWFAAVVAEARRTVPEARFCALLDCGEDAGAALAAIRAGVGGIIFTGRANVAHRLADIAQQHGLRVDTERPQAALDLAEDFFASPQQLERRCAEFLR